MDRSQTVELPSEISQQVGTCTCTCISVMMYMYLYMCMLYVHIVVHIGGGALHFDGY